MSPPDGATDHPAKRLPFVSDIGGGKAADESEYAFPDKVLPLR
jgi:hypothetical protein